MQTEDREIELPSPCLNSLDSALQQLGMLASNNQSRNEYLAEIQRKSLLNMVKINTRYVSNVSIGFRVRPLLHHVRYKPYLVRERHRTRSENNDNGNEVVKEAAAEVVDETTEELVQLKKAKSLESIVAESGDVDLRKVTIGPELEKVSNSIQNLRVVE